jgi:hypothetical protein
MCAYKSLTDVHIDTSLYMCICWSQHISIDLNVLMSFIVLIILSNVRITRKQAVLFSFEFISRLPSLTNQTSIICGRLISDLFVLHDITFFFFIVSYILLLIYPLLFHFSRFLIPARTHTRLLFSETKKKKNVLKNKKKQM